MKKAYVEIKSLGSTVSEPVYFMNICTNNEQIILFSDLGHEKIKIEGHLIFSFVEEIQKLLVQQKENSNYKFCETEKDIYLEFLDILKSKNINEIVVEDKLNQMLTIRERMRLNKFKPESYGFRDYKLSEDETSFLGAKENILTSLITKMKEVVKKDEK